MARRAKPNDAEGDGVINMTAAKDAVKEAVTKILSLRNDRKEINAAIGEQRARCKNFGVPPAALDLAIRMKESDPEDRTKHDQGYLIARDALGLRVQTDLFDNPDDDGEEGEAASGKEASGRKPRASAGAIGKARQHLGGAGAPDALN